MTDPFQPLSAKPPSEADRIKQRIKQGASRKAEAAKVSLRLQGEGEEAVTIAGDFEKLAKLGQTWTTLLSRHSVARTAISEDRNKIAGDVYEARKAFDGFLSHLAARVRAEQHPTDDEIEDRILLVCSVIGRQVSE